MKVSYFPGCTLKNKAKDLDLYAYKAAEGWSDYASYIVEAS